MSPTLRSATSTPTKKTTPIETTPTSTPTPNKRCKICKRPRLGHPRSGCPFGPAEDENVAPDIAGDVTEALTTLKLEEPLEDTKAAVRNRRRSSKLAIPSSESLESLSTTSSALLNNLAQPGMFDNDAEDAEEKVVRWKIDNYTPRRFTRKDKQMLMPCTLGTPSPESSIASIGSVYTPVASTSQTASPESHATPMSMDEFIDNVLKLSTVCAYQLPLEDILSIQSKAMKVGLFSHLVDAGSKNQKQTQGLLVIGKDGKAVQDLAEKLQVEAKNTVAQGGKGVGFRAGVVVGAAATFAGLAFS